jgi:hypothetical protein
VLPESPMRSRRAAMTTQVLGVALQASMVGGRQGRHVTWGDVNISGANRKRGSARGSWDLLVPR